MQKHAMMCYNVRVGIRREPNGKTGCQQIVGYPTRTRTEEFAMTASKATRQLTLTAMFIALVVLLA